MSCYLELRHSVYHDFDILVEILLRYSYYILLLFSNNKCSLFYSKIFYAYILLLLLQGGTGNKVNIIIFGGAKKYCSCYIITLKKKYLLNLISQSYLWDNVMYALYL